MIDIVSTAKVIEIYMEENDVDIAMLAKASNMSERSIYRFLQGDSKLPIAIAEGINSIIPEISVDFLLRYDASFQYKKQATMKSNNIKNFSQLSDDLYLKWLYPDIKDNSIHLAEKAKYVFGDEVISGKETIAEACSKYSFLFSKTKNNDAGATSAWLLAAIGEYKSIAKERILSFNKTKFDEEFEKLRVYSDCDSIEATLFNMSVFCKDCGINFYYRESIPKARVKAVSVKESDEHIYIIVSSLFKSIENLWLSFIHECIHIKNNDLEEKEPDDVLNENSVNSESIEFFVGKMMNKQSIFDFNTIEAISRVTNTPISIVSEIARFLSKDYKDSEKNRLIHYFKKFPSYDFLDF